MEDETGVKKPLANRSTAPLDPNDPGSSQPSIVLIDAASRAALRRVLAPLQRPDAAIAAPRVHSDGGGAHRLAIVYQDADELQKLAARALKALDDASKTQFNLGNRIFYRDRGEHDEPGKLAVLFPGFGSPHTDLAGELSSISEQTRERLSGIRTRRSEAASGALRESVLGASLDDTLLANLAMWFLITDLGVRCDLICGHSFGEHAAIVASGIIPGLSALDPIFAEVAASISDDDLGAVIAVTAAAADTVAGELSRANAEVRVALDNCPQQQIIWGLPPTLERLVGILSEEGQVVHRLDGLSLPIHTDRFPLSQERLQAAYRQLDLNPPRIPVWSASRLGFLPDAADALAGSLAAQWREPVRFRESLHNLYDDGVRIFLEVGAGEHLSGFARDTLRGLGVLAIPTHRERQPSLRALYVALAQLHVRGQCIDLDRLNLRAVPPATAANGDGQSDTDTRAGVRRMAGRSDDTTPPTASPDALLGRVQRAVAELLDEELSSAPDPDVGFFDLGLDSLACVTLIERIGGELRVALPQTLAFDHPTCLRLASAVHERISGASSASAATVQTPKQPAREAGSAPHEPIAIVGIGCRFPGGVTSPARFWQLLLEGQCAIRPVPGDRWNPDDYARWVLPEQRPATRFGGFLDGIDGFDAAFFGISMAEAQTLDPQQRLLLEVTWEALEDACIRPSALVDSRTGVYVGISHNEYAARFSPLQRLEIGGYMATGNAASTAAGRIAYTLGLNGPALAVDTACSSSLVTVHLACKGLQRGETDLALAGGVNLMLNPETTCHLANAHALAPDGRCKSFDASANGYVRAEGCGVLVLKRLADAIEQQDDIIAVVQGSAMNHDGKTSGLTVPSGTAQRALILNCLSDAGIQPEHIGYVEAHGTGTALGDPIELHALADRFAGARRQPLMLGSVKTNIGHLEAAAGVAGLIKAALQLRHGQLVASLNCDHPTPRFDWSNTPLHVNTALRAWPAGLPRSSLVSSFGISGTNAQVVLAAAPTPTSDSGQADRGALPLVVSARSPSALATLLSDTADHLERSQNLPFERFCRTALRGRNTWPQRVATVASTPFEAAERLRARRDELARLRDALEPTPPRLVFLFTGQGAQYPQMGKALYSAFPAFRTAFDRCAELLAPSLPGPLTQVIWGAETAKLKQTQWTQPALFALEYALAQLWQSWGIQPSAVIGHSIGEYVAACVAGVLPLADAVDLVAARARLMQSVPQTGGMTSVAVAREQVEQSLPLDTLGLDVAAANGPGSTVVSGPIQALAAAEAQLDAQGIPYQRLEVSNAFHSRGMEPILKALEHHAAGTRPAAPGIPVLSNLTGDYFGDTPIAPDYWAKQLRGTVEFEAGMRRLLDDGYNLFLELGPKPVLSALGQRLAAGGARAVWASSLQPPTEPVEALYRAAATLYEQGLSVDWPLMIDRDGDNRRARLPTYPFERRACWVSATSRPGALPVPTAGATADVKTRQLVPGAERIIPGLDDGNRRFETEADIEATPELRGYGPRLQSLPATLLLCDALAICRQTLAAPDWVLTDIEIDAGRPISDGRFSLHGVIDLADSPTAQLQIFAASPDPTTQPWALALSARVASPAERPGAGSRFDALNARAESIRSKTTPIKRDSFYATTRAYGLDYGHQLQGLEALYLTEDATAATFSLTEGTEDTAPQARELALLEACAQLIGAHQANKRPGGVAQIGSVGAIVQQGPIGASLTLLLQHAGDGDRLHLVALDPVEKTLVLELDDIAVAQTDPTQKPAAHLEIEDRLQAADRAEWETLIIGFVHRIVSIVLGLDAATRIAEKTPLVSLGLDSIMAMRISVEMRIDLGVELAPTDILACQDIGPLARRCAELRLQREDTPAPDSGSDELFEEGSL
jgi:acyl transferase domain-containing protein